MKRPSIEKNKENIYINNNYVKQLDAMFY